MGTFSFAERAGICALFLFLTTPALAQSATATRLVTASPSPIGQPVTMTAEIDAFAGSAPRGTVTFNDGATNLGSAFVNPLGAGQATLAGGGDLTCALTSNSGVKCWGDNAFGALGDGTTIHRRTPVWVVGLTTGVAAVDVGGGYGCALTILGAVKCWGANYAGQLGDGTHTNRLIAVTVSGLSSGAVAISVGGAHACAVTTKGDVWCWGRNTFGQLGNGSQVDSSTPTLLDDPGTVYAAVAAGLDHSCGLTTAGAVKCWGFAKWGAVGSGYFPVTKPRLVPGADLASGAVAVTAGYWHSCAITAAGALKCWGYNGNGEIGNGSASGRVPPVQVVGLERGVVAVSAGGYYTCALIISGQALCWGDNYTGQLGDGTREMRSTPTPVAALGGFAVSLRTGGRHACALLSPTRVLRCWGDNYDGQLGDGTTTTRLRPVSIANFSGLLRGRARLARTLAAGVHPLQARYLGDVSHAPSASAILQHKVQ